MIHILSMLVIIALIIGGGYSSAQAKNPSVPSYAEENLTAKAGLESPSRLFKSTSDGLLVVHDLKQVNSEYVFLDSTGRGVKSFAVDLRGDGSIFALDCLGNLCVLDSWPAKGTPQQVKGIDRRFIVFNEEGRKLRSVDLERVPMRATEPWAATDMAVDSNGAIYIGTNKGLEIYESNGKARRTQGGIVCQSVVADCDGFLYIAAFNPGAFTCSIQKLDPARGTCLWQVNVADMVESMQRDRGQDSLLVFDGRSVSRYSLDGKRTGSLIELRNTSVAVSLPCSASFVADGKGNLYFIARRQTAQKDRRPLVDLFKYFPAKENSQAKLALTISSGFSFDRFLDSAIGAFARTRPTVRMEFLRQFESKALESPSGFEEIARPTITELMAGKGADIINLAYLPYRNLVEHKLLLDLSATMASDSTFDQESLFPAIVDSCRTKGQLFILPAAFGLQVLLANGKFLDQASISINDASTRSLKFKMISCILFLGGEQYGREEISSLLAFEGTKTAPGTGSQGRAESEGDQSGTHSAHGR